MHFVFDIDNINSCFCLQHVPAQQRQHYGIVFWNETLQVWLSFSEDW